MVHSCAPKWRIIFDDTSYCKTGTHFPISSTKVPNMPIHVNYLCGWCVFLIPHNLTRDTLFNLASMFYLHFIMLFDDYLLILVALAQACI